MSDTLSLGGEGGDLGSPEALHSFIDAVEEFNIANSDALLSSVPHEDFIRLPQVQDLLNQIQGGLLHLATSADGDIAAYYELLALHLSDITRPETPSEIMYGLLMLESPLPFDILRFSLALYDFTYGIESGSDRRNTILAIGSIENRYEVPEAFLNYIKSFLQIDADFRSVIVDENLLYLGASQEARAKISGQRPSGSSHVINTTDGAKLILVRRYTSVVEKKIADTFHSASVFMSDDFWKKNFNNNYDTILVNFRIGQRLGLIAHEIAEGVASEKLEGANRARQECLYTAAGFMGLKELNRIGELSEMDLLNARVYQLSRIIMALSEKYTGDDYTPGYALMYQTLRSNGAFSFTSGGQIDFVDWSVFDKSMEQIAVELRETFITSDNPLVTIKSLPEYIQANDHFIRALIQKKLQKVPYAYA